MPGPITGGVTSSTPGTEDSLTAFAGGGQASATALDSTKSFHRITTCATAADSVKLPAATAGQSHFIRNDGAAACRVYGTSPDTINGVATGTGVSLPQGQGAWFQCTTAAAWTTTVGVGTFSVTQQGSTTPVIKSNISTNNWGISFDTDGGVGITGFGNRYFYVSTSNGTVNGAGFVTSSGIFNHFAGGTSSNPGYSSSQDTGCGMYIATGITGFSVTGAEKLRLTSAGATVADLGGSTLVKLSPSASNTADSSAISNTTTPTAFSVTKSIVTASFIAAKPVRFRAWLKYSTAAIPGTLTLKVQLVKSGPTTVEMSTSGALVVSGSQTNQGIMITGDLIPRTLGASGTIASHVEFTVSSDSLVVGSNIDRVIASGTAKVVDTTATQVLTIEATWATADASNTVIIESLITE